MILLVLSIIDPPGSKFILFICFFLLFNKHHITTICNFKTLKDKNNYLILSKRFLLYFELKNTFFLNYFVNIFAFHRSNASIIEEETNLKTKNKELLGSKTTFMLFNQHVYFLFFYHPLLKFN